MENGNEQKNAGSLMPRPLCQAQGSLTQALAVCPVWYEDKCDLKGRCRASFPPAVYWGFKKQYQEFMWLETKTCQERFTDLG